MSRLSKHLGKGCMLKIGEDEFELKPLSVEHLPLFFKVMKTFSGGEKPEDMFKNMDDGGLNALKDLIKITMEKSFPDVPEEERDEFGMKYMVLLMEKIIELNTHIDEREKRHIERKSRLKDGSTGSDKQD